MARIIEAVRPLAEPNPYTRPQVVDALKRSYQLVSGDNLTLDPLVRSTDPRSAHIKRAYERTKSGLILANGSAELPTFTDLKTDFTLKHDFSRTGEQFEFQEKLPVADLIAYLERVGFYEASMRYIALFGEVPDSDEQLATFNREAGQFDRLAKILTASSSPFIYSDLDLDDKEQREIWESRNELESTFRHFNEFYDSETTDPKDHSEDDWYRSNNRLRLERGLILPPEEVIAESTKGSRKWWGCLPLIAAGLGMAAIVCATQPTGREQLPPVVATAAAKGQPPIGIIPPPEGIVRPIFAPKPEASPTPAASDAPSSQPENQPEVAQRAADCVPEMEVIITEIVQQGDSDAKRIYRYPNRVNPEGDSVKGLFEKELAALYAKANPYSDQAIRFNLRNQPNEGRNVAAGDADLAILLDEARLFYGADVSDAAYLAFIDSIRRNNPPGTIVGDLINNREFKSQAPESLIKRLQSAKTS